MPYSRHIKSHKIIHTRYVSRSISCVDIFLCYLCLDLCIRYGYSLFRKGTINISYTKFNIHVRSKINLYALCVKIYTLGFSRKGTYIFMFILLKGCCKIWCPITCIRSTFPGYTIHVLLTLRTRYIAHIMYILKRDTFFSGGDIVVVTCHANCIKNYPSACYISREGGIQLPLLCAYIVAHSCCKTTIAINRILCYPYLTNII